MTTFLFIYRAPDNYVRGTAEGVAAWTAWFDGMGAAASHIVSRDFVDNPAQLRGAFAFGMVRGPQIPQ